MSGIAEYLPRQNRGKYLAIFTESEVNNCFRSRIIFRGEYDELEENWAKHEKHANVSKLSNHAKKSYNHCACGDYNAEFLYSPLKLYYRELILTRGSKKKKKEKQFKIFIGRIVKRSHQFGAQCMITKRPCLDSA